MTASAVPSSTPADLCAALSVDNVSAITGQPVTFDRDTASPDTCTCEVSAGSTSYSIALRIEGDFDDLASVKAAFADGEEIGGLGDGAYWAPAVSVLWFENGGQLFAVQLLAFAGDNAAARGLAHSIAESALPNL